MPDKKKTDPKAIEVPSTEASQKDDKATKFFVFYMAAAMAAIVIIGGIAIYQLGKAYVLESNKNKAQDKTIGLLETKQDNLNKLKPNYDAITAPGANGKSDADLILNAVPVDEGYKQLIAMIERMGQEAGVDIPSVSKSTSATATTSTGAASPYQISVSINGTFNQVMEFVKKTENSSRVMDFVSLSFNGSTKGGPVQSSAIFTVYWQGPANIGPTQEQLR